MSEQDNKSWVCPYCLVPNLPHNETCRSCKKARATTEELLEKNGRIEDRFAHGFLAVILTFALLAAVGMKLSPLVAIPGLLVCWWLGLALIASQPAWGNFHRTRTVATEMIAGARPENARQVLRVVFRFLYWPIFISKDVYFWLAMVLAGLWLYWTFVHG